MTVGELLHGRGTPMSSAEYTEWGLYWKIVNDEHEHRRAQNGGGRNIAADAAGV